MQVRLLEMHKILKCLGYTPIAGLVAICRRREAPHVHALSTFPQLPFPQLPFQVPS